MESFRDEVEVAPFSFGLAYGVVEVTSGEDESDLVAGSSLYSVADERERENMSALKQRMLSTLLASEGVDQGKVAGNVDIAAEREKWNAEWGEATAGRLERWVREVALPRMA